MVPVIQVISLQVENPERHNTCHTGKKECDQQLCRCAWATYQTVFRLDPVLRFHIRIYATSVSHQHHKVKNPLTLICILVCPNILLHQTILWATSNICCTLCLIHSHVINKHLCREQECWRSIACQCGDMPRLKTMLIGSTEMRCCPMPEPVGPWSAVTTAALRRWPGMLLTCHIMYPLSGFLGLPQPKKYLVCEQGSVGTAYP